jgi:hypothetical protein
MIELLLLAVASILYWIAQKYFSKEEDDFTCFGTTGTIIVIIATFLFLSSTLLAIHNAYFTHGQ